MRRRDLLITVFSAALAPIALTTPASAKPGSPPGFDLTSLGTPLTDVLVLGGTVAPGPNGKDALWIVTGGKPAHLQAVDPLTGAVLSNQALQHADGSYAEGAYAVTATPGGDIYVGSYYDGTLWRRPAGATSALVDLGQALAGDTYIWRIATDAGKVYGGTYPGGAVFGYDPATSAFRNYGQLLAGVQYARSTAAAGGKIYAGTQPDAHLFEIDETTGAKREITLPAGATGTVNDISVHAGLLYVRVGVSIINATLYVQDLATGEWIATIENVTGLDVSDPGPGGEVYFTVTDGAQGELVSWQPATRTLTRLGVLMPGRVTNSRGIGWVDLGDPAWPGKTLAQMLWRGSIVLYNPQTGASKMFDSQVQGEPIGIWSMAAGTHDVYLGGYLNGGLAVYDPRAGSTEFHRFAQIESIVQTGSQVWLGTYPDARKYVYDRTQTWSNAAYSPGPVGSPENPVLLDDGKAHNQVRTPSVADLGSAVVFGTQGNTQLTGTLVFVDKATKKVTVGTAPVADQGVVVLYAADRMLYGGTSIYGGYSVPTPTTTAGKLFAVDPRTRKLRWAVAPKAGQAAVTGVTVDAKQRVWALTNGTLTTHNPRNGALMRTIVVAPDSSVGAVRGDLAYDRRRNVVWALVGQQQLWRVDAQTGRKQLVLDRPMTRMVVHPSGDVYIGADAELLRVRSTGC